MKIYRARKTIQLDTFPGHMEDHSQTKVFKGQMFYVDSQSELPQYNDPGKPEYKEYWQELELYNNYGSIKLTPKY